FFSSRRRHTRSYGDWSSDVCSSDLTCWEPGTTMARTRDATLRPCTTRAALLRSSIRALVQEPRKTRSIGRPASGVPGLRSIYSRSEERRVGKECRERWAKYPIEEKR